MSNPHYLYNSQDVHHASSSSSSRHLYSPANVVHQTTSAGGPDIVAMSTSDHGHAAASLSPISPTGWPYAISAQVDAAVYSPTSPTSYGVFRSPVESNPRPYALAGALQQPSPTFSGMAMAQRTQSPTVPAIPPSMRSQWPYNNAHAYSQKDTPMSQSPIPQSTSSSAATRHVTGLASPRIPSAYPGSSTPKARDGFSAEDQRVRAGARQAHGGVSTDESVAAAMPSAARFGSNSLQGVSLAQGRSSLRMQSQHAVAPQPQLRIPSTQIQSQGQHGHAGDARAGAILGTTNNIHSPSPQSAHSFASHAQAAFHLQTDSLAPEYDGFDSEDDDDDDDFDEEGFEIDGMGRVVRVKPDLPPASPTPELQYPPGASGTQLDLLRSAYIPNVSNYTLSNIEPGSWSDEAAYSNAGPSTSGSGMQGIQSNSRGRSSVSDTYSLKNALLMPDMEREGTDSESKTSLSISVGGRGDKGKRSQVAPADLEETHQTVKVLIQSTIPGEPPKKVKMHQCRICQKLFPRPSGLATHMNSHSGARPFKCPLALCNKTFAVRSNARRHLRTHGITVPQNGPGKFGPGRSQPDQPFHVGFDTPVVVDVHDFGRSYVGDGTNATGAGRGSSGGSGAKTQKLRWVPSSLASRTNAMRLRSLSPASDMADLDADAEYEVPESDDGIDNLEPPMRQSANSGGSWLPAGRPSGARIAATPLPPAVPSESSPDVYSKFDERNSFAEAGTYPYHPQQWRCLPGPGS